MNEQVIIKKTVFHEISVATGSWNWARLLMEESTGRVVIVSDYGDWSYCWTSIGERSLAEFLHGLNSQYMGEKLLGSGLRSHDDDSTIKGLRNLIVEYRKDGVLTKEEAAAEWEYVKQYEDGWGDFRWWCDQTEFFDCPYDYSIYQPVACWTEFWNRIWTPLIKPALREIYVSEANEAGV